MLLTASDGRPIDERGAICVCLLSACPFCPGVIGVETKDAGLVATVGDRDVGCGNRGSVDVPSETGILGEAGFSASMRKRNAVFTPSPIVVSFSNTACSTCCVLTVIRAALGCF